MLYMTIPAIGSFPRITIEASELEFLEQANSTIKHLLSIEEKFDFIIGNYRELQLAQITKAMDSSLYQIRGVKTIYDDSREINRKLFNFLTSATLYLDYLKRNKKKDIEIYSKIEGIIKNKSTNAPSFKLMESLRDHMQHYDISTWASNAISRVGEKDKSNIFFYTRIVLNVQGFLRDSKIRRLFPEFVSNNSNIEINDIIADYLDDLVHINENVRKLFNEKMLDSKKCIDKWISQYEDMWPKMKTDWQKTLGVSELAGNGFIFMFSRNSLDLLEDLLNRNSSYSSFGKRILSNVSGSQLDVLRKE